MGNMISSALQNWPDRRYASRGAQAIDRNCNANNTGKQQGLTGVAAITVSFLL
jgi:hypothetical protein